ncbi:hypothetical protein O3G_MSEX012983 [Manduca sexta]|uniref:Ig-like domain-containing protein n=1 Tax=Manduca sexta TaxID=7130 RepID=A0A922CYM4_MANSE|nr:hypothetical protein O3G_MSEX012983 [Manduca sexta]
MLIRKNVYKQKCIDDICNSPLNIADPRFFLMLQFTPLFLKGVQSVRIVNMRVPEAIQYGTRDKVTLDCEYNTRNVTGLVVKWFYNDRSQQVYQWIPPQKPQALGLLKDKLDLNFKVSNDPYTQQRALRIVQPVPELTGNYTCVVSTFLGL